MEDDTSKSEGRKVGVRDKKLEWIDYQRCPGNEDDDRDKPYNFGV